MFFETLNEPEIRDRYRWNGIHAHLVAAIREGAPKQTIIVEGARWADDDDLVFMGPVRDPNVIYNFHFLRAALVYASGSDVGRELAALLEECAVSLDEGECGRVSGIGAG